MSRSDTADIDLKSPPFDRLRNVRPLATTRSGREGAEHARHQFYVGRDAVTAAQMLVKVTTRPGVFYERNLMNEIEALTTVNRELPSSKIFPVVEGHGRLPDSRLYMLSYLFDEFALATSIDSERARTVLHLRTTIAIARAVMDLHRIPVFHVDLNPMNILVRLEQGRPVVRIIDFESSYEPARHRAGVFYDPPTTEGYSAPEVSRQPPDARADVFSVGAVLYTELTGFDWTWHGPAASSVAADQELDSELKAILLSAVAPDPDGRFGSMESFHGALSSYLESIWPGRSW
jgi:serine/threonine protein kinase